MDPSAVSSWDQLRGYLLDGDPNPDTAEAFDRHVSRRKFLRDSGALALLGGMGAGVEAALTGLFGRGLVPAAWAQEPEAPAIAGKTGMLVHSSRPINGEFAQHLLDDDVTPIDRHFVRNNGAVPMRAEARDVQDWVLKVDGEVSQELSLSMADLKAMPSHTLSLLIECAGNGRSFFDPPVRGTPWLRGALGCSRWTGVRLRDVLERAGLKPTAKYTAHYGDDPPLGAAEPYSRGVPIDKAMEEHTLIAYQMNGEDLPALHGFPVRLIVPGWAGSCSQKWLNRIWVRDKQHDSQKMTGYSYRVPAYPVEPGSRPPEEDMVVVTSWAIKSMITRPQANAAAAVGEKLAVAGHAWAGEGTVQRVAVSTDYGIQWKDATLTAPPNKYAWYRWETDVAFANKGYYEIWARAFDAEGNAQPFSQPWNPKGYMCNVIDRLPVRVGI